LDLDLSIVQEDDINNGFHSVIKNISEKIKLIDKSIEHSTIFWIIPECEFFLKTKYLPYITTYYLIYLKNNWWNHRDPIKYEKLKQFNYLN